MDPEREAELTRQAEEAYADGTLAKEDLEISEFFLSGALPIDQWDDVDWYSDYESSTKND